MTADIILPNPAPSKVAKQVTRVSEKTRIVLWARASGRCQFRGCNQSLIGDLIAGNEDANFGFVAHVIADKPGGPRGDPLRSPLLRDSVGNLMLLCYTHHKLIDVDAVKQYPEEILLEMKAEHEARVAITTAIDQDKGSHILRYAAKIGGHESLVAYKDVASAMLPERFPKDGKAIDIEMTGTPVEDDLAAYWEIERTNLRQKFMQRVKERIEAREIDHLSVFALAPIPLLVELGRLLGDITTVDVYQRHREPPGWGWPADPQPLAFEIIEPYHIAGPPALILSLSGHVEPQRVTSAIGAATIWQIVVPEPHNDIVKSPADLARFRTLMRKTFNAIKRFHGEHEMIHIFAASPVSLSVELGRVWMPKADLPLILYDQNRKLGGFQEALRIGPKL